MGLLECRFRLVNESDRMRDSTRDKVVWSGFK